MLIHQSLNHYGLIRFSGSDAEKFLQGQLTQDMSLVKEGSVSLTGYCTPKGRLLASGLVWRDSQGFWWQPRAELSQALIKRLTMFILRDKVVIEDFSHQYLQIGLFSAHIEAALESLSLPCPLKTDALTTEQGLHIIRYHSDRVIIIGETSLLSKVLALNHSEEHHDLWQQTQIIEGFPEITLSEQDQWIPQMVNMDLIQAVSFKKGCYTGQEIVARTHYLGQVKRRTFLFSCSAATIEESDILVSVSDQNSTLGHVINCCHQAHGDLFLAVVQVDAMRQKVPLMIARNNISVTAQSLPYVVISDL